VGPCGASAGAQELLNASGEEGNLNFRGAGVAFVALEGTNDVVLLVDAQRHGEDHPCRHIRRLAAKKQARRHLSLKRLSRAEGTDGPFFPARDAV